MRIKADVTHVCSKYITSFCNALTSNFAIFILGMYALLCRILLLLILCVTLSPSNCFYSHIKQQIYLFFTYFTSNNGLNLLIGKKTEPLQ